MFARMNTPTEEKARAMLRYGAESPDNTLAPAGSVYLYALAAAYLSAPDESDDESTLERLFLDRAIEEDVDADEILTALCLVEAA